MAYLDYGSIMASGASHLWLANKDFYWGGTEGHVYGPLHRLGRFAYTKPCEKYGLELI